jgi:hypothetical protein
VVAGAGQEGAVKERPIIFSAESVRAILTGRKTQTRRLVRVPSGVENIRGFVDRVKWGGYDDGGPHGIIMSPHTIGDRLWVRETWGPCAGGVVYRVDDIGGSVVCPDGGNWRTPIYMPRWASRIDLEITDVRVQRLQDISEEDAMAEGVKASDAAIVFQGDAGEIGCHIVKDMCNTARGAFACAWDAINGKRAPWSSNPWVWALTFKRVRPC